VKNTRLLRLIHADSENANGKQKRILENVVSLSAPKKKTLRSNVIH